MFADIVSDGERLAVAATTVAAKQLRERFVRFSCAALHFLLLERYLDITRVVISCE